MFFLFYRLSHHRDLHSFPTRRSSDLPCATARSSRRRWSGSGAKLRRSSGPGRRRSEEYTSDSSHVAISYAVFCLKKKNHNHLFSLLVSQRTATSVISTCTVW